MSMGQRGTRYDRSLQSQVMGRQERRRSRDFSVSGVEFCSVLVYWFVVVVVVFLAFVGLLAYFVLFSVMGGCNRDGGDIGGCKVNRIGVMM